MKALVCGGRDYPHSRHIHKYLDLFHSRQPISKVIQGGARGVDRYALKWAKKNGIDFATYRADWNTYPRAAGAIRNATMLDHSQPDVVIAFPGGKGTTDMVMRADRGGFKVIDLRLSNLEEFLK